MQLLKKLSAPFPYTRGLVVESLSALRACILASVILFLIRPFGLNEASTLTILGFGGAVFVSALINILIAVFIVRRMVDEEEWTVWKEIIRTLIYLSFNVVAIMWFAHAALPIALTVLVVLKFIGFTILFAIIPISIRTISVQNWLLKQQLKEARELANIIEEKPTERSPTETIVLKSNIVNDVISTSVDQLLFIEADKNYITIVENIEGRLRQTLLRLSLTKAKEQIENDVIIRCHRSYLVNISAVTKVIGNSQGLKLIFSEESVPVPVSRTYKDDVVKRINQFRSSST